MYVFCPADRTPVLSVPDTALEPDHEPDAVHDTASVESQFKLAEDPTLTDIGPSDPFAFMLIVGSGSCVHVIEKE